MFLKLEDRAFLYIYVKKYPHTLKITISDMDLGFPGDTRGKEPACQCRRHKSRGFDP